MLTGHLPKQIDHRKLASQGGDVSGLVSLQSLTRFSEMLEESEGDVRVELNFHQGEGRKTCVDGQASVEVSLICQNCMTVYEHTLTCQVHSEIVTAEQPLDDDNLRDQLVHAEKLIPLVDLIEDDLILAAPMIPRHEGPCPEGEYHLPGDAAEEVVPELETHRPFADLAKAINEKNKLES